MRSNAFACVKPSAEPAADFSTRSVGKAERFNAPVHIIERTFGLPMISDGSEHLPLKSRRRKPNSSNTSLAPTQTFASGWVTPANAPAKEHAALVAALTGAIALLGVEAVVVALRGVEA